MTGRSSAAGTGVDDAQGAGEHDDQFRRALDRLHRAQANTAGYSWLEAMVNQIPDYIYAKDRAGRFVFVNRAIVVDNGLQQASDLIGKTDFDLHSFEDADSIARVETMVMETGRPDLGIEEQALRGDGECWLMMSRLPLRDNRGEVIGVVGMSRDITIRKKAERLMQAQSSLLELVVAGMPLDEFLERLVLMIEEQHGGLRGAVMLRALRGDHLDLVAAPSLPTEIRGLIRPIKIGPASRVAGQGEHTRLKESRNGLTEDSLRLLAQDFGLSTCSSTPILSYKGEVLGSFTLFIEQSGSQDARHDELTAIAVHLAGIAIERHRTEQRIHHMARHDALTGLPNRLLLDTEFPKILAEAVTADSRVGVAFLDVDNFKVINDSLGHAVGDELLKIVAVRVSDIVGDSGMVVRVGGDEFILIIWGPQGQDLAPRFEAARLAVAAPITLDDFTFQVTCSMGMAYFPEHGKTHAELLTNADTAMYRVKEAGRNGLEVFSAEMAEKAKKKLVLIEELRRALEERQFVLHFQPQQNRTSGEIFAAEALVRWNHPVKGLLPPLEFIPLAEETGLIVALGDWILLDACRQCKKWQDDGMDAVTVCVNVSARQFSEKGWADKVAATLTQTGLEARHLELEITESLIMQDLAGAQQRMRELTALGVKLSIDDFGTGYSSLSALKSFPVSQLKIDRSFVNDIPGDADNMAIISAIISLSQRLGLEVIAEGVETEAQAGFLVECGCVNIQGYLVGKPVPEADFVRFLCKTDPV